MKSVRIGQVLTSSNILHQFPVAEVDLAPRRLCLGRSPAHAGLYELSRVTHQDNEPSIGNVVGDHIAERSHIMVGLTMDQTLVPGLPDDLSPASPEDSLTIDHIPVGSAESP